MDSISPSRRVVVTGLGAVTALGHNVADFWASLLAGRPGVHRVGLFDPSSYASQIGAEVRNWDAAQQMDPKEARRNDRYTRPRHEPRGSGSGRGNDWLRYRRNVYLRVAAEGFGGTRPPQGFAIHDPLAHWQHVLRAVCD
jgi:hypothetical protein